MKTIKMIGYAGIASAALVLLVPSMTITESAQARTTSENGSVSVVHRVSHTLAADTKYTAEQAGNRWGHSNVSEQSANRWGRSNVSEQSANRWGRSNVSEQSANRWGRSNVSEQSANRWGRSNVSEQSANRWGRSNDFRAVCQSLGTR